MKARVVREVVWVPLPAHWRCAVCDEWFSPGLEDMVVLIQGRFTIGVCLPCARGSTDPEVAGIAQRRSETGWEGVASSR